MIKVVIGTKLIYKIPLSGVNIFNPAFQLSRATIPGKVIIKAISHFTELSVSMEGAGRRPSSVANETMASDTKLPSRQVSVE
ncbi:hypothetical protein D3C77_248070 [compost metagenome]